MKKLLYAIALLFGLRAPAQAPGTGSYNFAPLESHGFDQINLANLNVRFNIPLVSRQGRGMPFNYALQYEGLIWSAVNTSGVSTWQNDPDWGFHGQLNGTGLSGSLTFSTYLRSCPRPPNTSGPYPNTAENYTNFVYHDTYGASHKFNYTEKDPCPNDTSSDPVIVGDGSTSDGSGYSFTTNGQIKTRDGKLITPVVAQQSSYSNSITDSNGNQITSTGGTFTDTLGVNALTIAGSGTSGSPRTFSYPVTKQSDGSTTKSATVSYVNYTIATNFQCSGISEVGQNGSLQANLVDTVQLASGDTYHFTYEPTPGFSGKVTGRLHQVTLPTGGTITYSYSGGCSSAGAGINTDGSVGSLSRTTSDGTRSYARSIQGQYVTNITDEKSNLTTATFFVDTTSNLFFEGHRQTFQGASNGTLLLDRQTCYNGQSAPCTSQTLTLPITQNSVLESFNGGSQVLTSNTYDPSGSLLTNSTVSSGGSTLTSTAITYNSLGEPVTVTSSDGSQTQYAKTTYGYDETALTATSNLPNHTAPTGTRGNLTSTVISGSPNVTTKATYNDAGMPVSSQAADGGTTTYAYDSTGAFVQGTVLPTPSSGVALSTSATYDASSASLLSSTGMNSGQTTTVQQYDALLRPSKVQLPSGSVVTNSVITPPLVTRATQTLDASRTMVKDQLVDAYGRLSRAAVHNTNAAFNNDWNRVDYCYDASGLLRFKSTPYQGNGVTYDAIHCSGAGVSYSYDALSRLTGVTLAEGTAKTEYAGRAVRTTSFTGVQRIVQYDGLGRIGSVCEVSSNTFAGISPSACSTDFGGSITGFTTTYTYSLVNHTVTVAQGQQTRVFQTDAAGRTISVTEPERSAPTTYSYAYNQYGLAVTRTRPKANQTNASVKTNTTTQYDLLGRVISVGYDDGLTANKNFYYDTSVNMPFGATSVNAKGQLTGTTTSANTKSQYSYDAGGNIANVWQCAPSICSSNIGSRGSMSMSYDLAGGLVNSTAGVAGSISYGRSVTEEVISVTNNTYTDPTNTPALVSNVTNGAVGFTHLHFGNNTSNVRSFDTMGRISGSWLCSGTGADGQTQGCANNSQMYAFLTAFTGSVLTNQIDSVMSDQGIHYDEMGRMDWYSGCCTQAGFVYDRWGNRLSESGAASFSFDPATNHNTSFAFDAAGNQQNDAVHQYTYDAEGKVLTVDGGSTARYTYDALDQRVRVQKASVTYEYMFDTQGHRISTWQLNGTASGAGNEARIYWDYGLLAHRAADGTTYFHHTDWLGTDRIRTDHNGAVVDTLVSNAFGDASSESSTNTAGPAQDNNRFTSQDFDSETATNHFLYRQFSPVQGRWMSPDPSSGSYDFSKPQSFNRYSYVLNDPESLTDPLGLDCTPVYGAGSTEVSDGNGGVIALPTGWTCSGSGSGGRGGVPWYISEYGGAYGPATGQCLLSNGATIPCGAAKGKGASAGPASGSNSGHSSGHTSVYYRCVSGLIGRAAFAGVSDAFNKVSIGVSDVLKLGKVAAPGVGVVATVGAEALGATVEGAAVIGSLASGVAEGAALAGSAIVLYNAVNAASDYAEAHPCSN